MTKPVIYYAEHSDGHLFSGEIETMTFPLAKRYIRLRKNSEVFHISRRSGDHIWMCIVPVDEEGRVMKPGSYHYMDEMNPRTKPNYAGLMRQGGQVDPIIYVNGKQTVPSAPGNALSGMNMRLARDLLSTYVEANRGYPKLAVLSSAQEHAEQTRNAFLDIASEIAIPLRVDEHHWGARPAVTIGRRSSPLAVGTYSTRGGLWL